MRSLTYPGLTRLLIGTFSFASCGTSKAIPSEDPQPVEEVRSLRADTGPQFERDLGIRESVMREPFSVSAAAYFRYTMPATPLFYTYVHNRLELGVDRPARAPVQPRDPHHGTFSLDAYGNVQHNIYSKPEAKLHPALPNENSPVSRILSTLRRLDLQLGFEGEDEHRGLRTRVEWERGE